LAAGPAGSAAGAADPPDPVETAPPPRPLGPIAERKEAKISDGVWHTYDAPPAPPLSPCSAAAYPLTGEQAGALHLRDALAQSLESVPVVQAYIATRTATVGRLDALRSFLPLVTMPQLAYGLRRAEGEGAPQIAFPGVTLSGSTFNGFPELDRVASNGVNIFFPLDPSGQITALPIAEHGVRVKQFMEELARRSQMVLAAQHYFDAKQVLYNLRVAEVGITTAEEALAVLRGRLREQQAFPIEAQQAEVDLGKARLNRASLDRQRALTQRELGLVLHRSRLLIPQEQGPFLIEPQQCYEFELADPDCVDTALILDFPTCRTEAVALAKRRRLEVRILVEGVAIARLQQKRNALRLLGLGSIPLALANRELTGKTSLGLLFGTYYEVPGFDAGLWANLRRADLDVVRSQLDLERSLLDVANDAANAWDKLVLAGQDWQQRQAEERLAREVYRRQEERFRQRQAIRLEVLGAQLNLTQAEANLWTSWYNLQLSRLDVLRATELLLDYAERVVPHPLEAGAAGKKAVGGKEWGFWPWTRRKLGLQP
jgi:outer membrane protein TolC